MGLRNGLPQEAQEEIRMLRDSTGGRDNTYLQGLTDKDIQKDIKRRGGGLSMRWKNHIPTIKALLDKKTSGNMSQDEEEALALLNPEIADLLRNTQLSQESLSERGGASFTTTALQVRAGGDETGNQYIDSLTPQKAVEALTRGQPYMEVIDYDEKTGAINKRYVPRLYSGGANADKQLSKRVADTVDVIEKSRIGAIAPAVKVIDEKVVQFDQTGEIEGIGRLKNLKMASFLKTEEGRHFQSVVSTLFSEELRQASGLAVTVPEEDRKKISDSLHPSNSAADFIKTYKTLIRPRLENVIRQIKARGGPRVVEILKTRGLDLDSMISTAGKTIKPENRPANSDDAAKRNLRRLLDGNKR